MSDQKHSTSRPAAALELFVVRPTLGVGGADRVTITLLQQLSQSRFRPTLVLMRDEGELLDQAPPDVPVLSLRARSLWSAWIPLTRHLRKHRPDIVFSTSGGTNLVVALAHLLAGTPSRLVLSERNHLRTELSWKKKLQKSLKQLLYPLADRITVVSTGVKEELVERLRLRPESISVVYNPVVDPSIDALAGQPTGHPWFEDGLERSPVILTAGRLVLEKDHATLLRAFAKVRATHDARLVILGTGPLQSQLENIALALGISESVSFPGFDPNPFKYMARCQMFVLSSRYEGLPGALIQAMACGAPVISTDCPSGPAEIFKPPGSGALVPVGDSNRLCEAMKLLIERPEIRRERGDAARTAAQRFTVERTIEGYIEALL